MLLYLLPVENKTKIKLVERQILQKIDNFYVILYSFFSTVFYKLMPIRGNFFVEISSKQFQTNMGKCIYCFITKYLNTRQQTLTISLSSCR